MLPPAANEYAVDPVGVAMINPRQGVLYQTMKKVADDSHTVPLDSRQILVVAF